MTSAPPKHILHFSSVHQVGDVRIFLKECRSLAAAGYQVTLIARGDTTDTVDGVRRIGVPRHRRWGRLGRMVVDTTTIARMAWKEHADAYHFHDPELIPFALVMRLLGKPVVYDVHESVTKQIMSKEWLPGWSRKVVSRAYGTLEYLTGRVLTAAVVATPAIAGYFPQSKAVVVQNFPIIAEFEAPSPNRVVAETPATVCYVGGVTRERGLREMMAAVQLAAHEHPVRLVVGGNFAPPGLRDECESYPGRELTDFVGMLDRAGVASVMADARAGLVVLHPEPNYIDSYPVKMFEYMAAGLPVVASDFPFWRQFVADTGAGVMVNPMDPVAIAEGILTILRDPEGSTRMGEAGRAAVQDRFGWEAESRKLVAMYRRILGA